MGFGTDGNLFVPEEIWQGVEAASKSDGDKKEAVRNVWGQPLGVQGML